MSKYQTFNIQPEMVSIRATSEEEALRMARHFYQQHADLSYFHGGVDTKVEPIIGPGCHYDITVESEEENSIAKEA